MCPNTTIQPELLLRVHPFEENRVCEDSPPLLCHVGRTPDVSGFRPRAYPTELSMYEPNTKNKKKITIWGRRRQ